MIRRSSTSSFCLLAVFAIGCGAGRAHLTLEEGARRQPDGVAIDPTSAPPPPREQAKTTDGLVTLRTPLGADRAFAALDEFFRKVLAKDDRIETLFTKDALAIGTTPTSGGPQEGANRSLYAWWKARFVARDYTRLAGETIYQPGEVDIYRAGDDVESPASTSIHMDALSEGDVVLRVPIITPRLGSDRYFGDEMIFWLRREGDHFKIYRILEDFTLT